MKWTKYIVSIGMFLGCIQTGFGQQRPQYTQYMVNPFLLNPAVSGTEDYTDIRAGYRKQWTGFEGSPRTMYLSAHTNFGKHLVTENRSRHKKTGFHGLGGIITNDAIGPTVSTTINGAYSYHMKISKGRVTKKRGGTYASLGVMGGINQFSLDASKLVAADAGDGLITSSSKIALGDITLGAWVYSDKFYLGASLAQVAPTVAITRTGELADYSLTNHYFVMAGYAIPFGYNFKLIPSVCIKGTTPAPLSFDINAKIRYKDFLWGGFSYRNTDAVAIMVGVVVNNTFDISYSYDYITSDINKYTGGSHEIVIGYRLKKQGILVCPSNFW